MDFHSEYSGASAPPFEPATLAEIVEDHDAERPWTWADIRWTAWWVVLMFAVVFAAGGLAIGEEWAGGLLAICVLTSLYSLGPWLVWRVDRAWLAALATAKFSRWGLERLPRPLPRRTTAARLWNLWHGFIMVFQLVCLHQIENHPQPAGRPIFIILFFVSFLLFLIGLASCGGWYRERRRLIGVIEAANLMDFGFALEIGRAARQRLAVLPWFSPEKYVILRNFLDGQVGPWPVWVFDWLDPQNPVTAGRGWQTLLFVQVRQPLPAFDLIPTNRPVFTKGMVLHVVFSILHGPAGWAMLLVTMIARLLGSRRKPKAETHVDLPEAPEIEKLYELQGEEPRLVRDMFRGDVVEQLLERDAWKPATWMLQARERWIALVRVGRSCPPADLPRLISRALELAASLEANVQPTDAAAHLQVQPRLDSYPV